MMVISKKLAVKTALFIVLLLCFWYSGVLYSAGRFNISALLFFIALGAFMLFISRGKETVVSEFDGINTSRQPMLAPLIKFFAVVILVLLGQFFLIRSMFLFGYAAYIFAYLQTYFIFKNEKIAETKGVETPAVEPAPAGFPVIKFLLLIFAAILFYLSLGVAVKSRFHLFFLYFIFAVCLLLLLRKNIFKQDAAEVLPANGAVKTDFIIAGLLFIAAFILRYYRILEAPPGLDGDEIDQLLLARSMTGGAKYGMYISGIYNYATFYTSAMGLVGKFIPLTIEVMRITSSLFGALSVGFLYLLIREIFTRRIALLSSAVLLVMAQYLLFSRHSGLMVFTPALAVISFYFYFMSARRGSVPMMMLSGALLGLNIYFYTAGRMAPFVYVIYWAGMLAFARNRRQIFSNYGMIAMLILTSLIVFAPMADFIAKNPSVYFARMAEKSMVPGIFKNPLFVKSFADQFMIYFRFFFTDGSIRGLHSYVNQSSFDKVTLYFMIAGCAALLFRWKSRGGLFLIAWTFCAMLVGMFSFADDLYPCRLTMVLPAVAVLAGLGMDMFLGFFDNLANRAIKNTAIAAACVLLAVMGGLNINSFFVRYSSDPAARLFCSYQYNRIRGAISAYKDSRIYYSKYYISQYTEEQMTTVLLSLNKQGQDVDFSLGELSRLYNAEGKGALLIGENSYRRYFELYKGYFPGAVIKPYYNLDYFLFSQPGYGKNLYGWNNPDFIISKARERIGVYDLAYPYVSFVTCYIPPEDIKNAFGLNGVFTAPGGASRREKVNSNQMIFNGQDEKAELSGLIDIPEYGEYELFVKGVTGSSVYLDGRLHSGRALLYRGLHRIRVIINAKPGESAVICWKKQGASEEVIPSGNFIASDFICGLMSIQKDGTRAGYSSIDPMVEYNNYFYNARPGMRCESGNCTVNWSGYINIEEKGSYDFYLRTDRWSKVSIDGIQVAVKEQGKEPELKHINLSTGWHRIEASTQASQVETFTQLLFKKSGSALFSYVPYDRLTPFSPR